MAINTNLTTSSVVVNNIQSLADTPSSLDGLTTATFKAKFDQSAADEKTFINSTLIPELDTKFNDIQTATDGAVVALATKQKAITSGTADPTGGADGDIYIQYV